MEVHREIPRTPPGSLAGAASTQHGTRSKSMLPPRNVCGAQPGKADAPAKATPRRPNVEMEVMPPMPERPVFSSDVAKAGGGGGPAAVKPEAGVAAKQPARAPEQLPAKPIPTAIKAPTKVPPPLPVGAKTAPIMEASVPAAVAQQTSKAAAPKTAGPAPAAESPPGAAPAAAPEDPKTPESDLRLEPTPKPTTHASAKTAKEEMMGAAPSQAKAMDEDVYSEDVEEALLAEALMRVKRKRQEQMESQDQSPGGR